VSGWPDVLALAEGELALLRGGDAESLPAALAERERLTAALGPAPASARPVLERIAAVQDQLICELTIARDEVARDLAALRRGQGAMNGYRAVAGTGGPRAQGFSA
jgi:hypothetical protein